MALSNPTHRRIQGLEHSLTQRNRAGKAARVRVFSVEALRVGGMLELSQSIQQEAGSTRRIGQMVHCGGGRLIPHDPESSHEWI